MGELAQLITAIAALVTSIGGAAAAIIVATRSGRRHRTAIKERRADVDTLPETEDEGGLSVEDAQRLMDLIERLHPPPGGSGS